MVNDSTPLLQRDRNARLRKKPVSVKRFYLYRVKDMSRFVYVYLESCKIVIQSLSMILFLDLEKKQCPSPAFCNKLDSHSSPITSSNSFYYYFTIYNLGAEVGRMIGSPVKIPSDVSAPPPPSNIFFKKIFFNMSCKTNETLLSSKCASLVLLLYVLLFLLTLKQ